MRSPLFLATVLSLFAVTAPAAEITGRVLNERRGVVGATVAAYPYETPFAIALRETRGQTAPVAIAMTTTSGEGRFKLVVPETAAAFVVRASFGGLAPRTVDGVFEKTDAEDLGEIALNAGDAISGRVVDSSGKPVSGATVRLGRESAPTVTSKDGLFRFEDQETRIGRPFSQAPVLSVHARGFEVQAATPLASGAPVTVKLKPSMAKLAGSLKDWNGRPAAGATVRIAGAAVTPWVLSDAAGRFEIEGAPSKQSRVEAWGRDGSSLDVAVPTGAAPASFTLSRAATIEGRVTRLDDGKLVPGTKVTVRSRATTQVARTSADGRYRLSGLPAGTYRVRFDEKRFVLLTRQEVEVAAGEVKSLDVALTPAVSLVGRVSDEKGEPVSGARGVLSAGAESRLGMMFRAVRQESLQEVAFVSEADGSFKASRLSPGTNQKLSVSHPDFERRVVPGVDLVPGSLRPLSIEIVLSPGFVLSGTVKDKEGQPIAGAQVTVNRSMTLQGGRGGTVMSFNTIESVRPQAETDFEGNFGFKGLQTGDYDVAITKSGFTRSTSNGVKVGDGAGSLDVVLNPGATINGRLVQPNGLPVSGYMVSASPSSTETGRGSMMMRGREGSQADPDGSFFLDGLTPGTAYDLSIFGAGEFRGDAKKKNVVAPATDVEIEVAARGRITGKVVDAASGAPLTEFEASYTQARSGGMVIVMRGGPGEGDRRTPFSSPDGAFAFEDVPPGNWDVTVWAKTYQDARTGGIAVAAGETKTVEVKAARGLVIRGRVVDAKGGGGVQDASVSARADGDAGGMVFSFGGGGLGEGVVTDADGRFEIVGQAPGAYQLTARHSLFSEGTARVTLDGRDGNVEIPLTGGGTIAGVVISSQGAPLSGAEVTLQNSGDGGGMRFGMEGQGTLTDGLGRFRFEHLAAARYKVGATLRTEASPFVDVPLNAGDVREDIRLTLDAGTTVRGVVSGLPENERGGLMVGAVGAQEYFANTRTNADGSFEFVGVPTGTVTLRATAGDLFSGSSRTAIREVAIADGQLEASTEIVFSDGLSISGTVTRRGLPVSGARVSAFMTGVGRQASARVDENGAFRIVGLEAGRVNLTAFVENFSSQVSQVVELTADTTIDLVIPTAKLAGAVLDGASGLPLESAVELQRATPAAGASGGLSRMMSTTDTSGRFAFDDLEPVEYRLSARRSGYESTTLNVTPTESGEDLRIELKRGSGLSVEARDAQMGFGLRSLFVRVQQGAIDSFAGTVSLDGEGKGEIPGLPPGSYSLVAQASGYAPVRLQNVAAPSTLLRLAFTPGGSVEFRTTEEFLASGSKAGQLVSLTGAPIGMGASGSNVFRLSRLTQRMDNLSPGRYRLTLEGGVDKTFEISEGGVAVVTIP